VASIPAGAKILTIDQALGFHPQWSTADRVLARQWIGETGVTDFYVPPSGGYVAGHGGPNRSLYRDVPVNGLVMHVGFLHVWPNDEDGGERIELSHSRGLVRRGSSSRRGEFGANGRTCPKCFIEGPEHLDECPDCGHDFAAARAASIARWHESQQRRAAGNGHPSEDSTRDDRR
jgi:hypothetical protein